MINANVDNGIEHKLADFYKDAKRPLHDILKQVARAECRSFAMSTQPYTSGDGGWDESRKTGMRRVAIDIGKLYATKGSAFLSIRKSDPGLADAFYYLFSAGKIGGKKGAQALLAASKSPLNHLPIENFNPVIHKEARGRGGRVKGGVRSLVKNESKLKSYISQKQKMVGFAKGGWAAAARQLGGVRGIPGWITRQKTPGSATDRSRAESNPYVIIHNHLSYAKEVLPPGAEADALKGAHDRLRLMIETAVAKAAERAAKKSALT